METNENPNPSPAAAPARKKRNRAPRNASEEVRMAVALGSIVRWQILRELAKGQALPVAELIRRIKGEKITYHMKTLVTSGWVERKFGTLYALTDTVRVDTAAGMLDLGPLILKLDMPAK